MQLIILAAGKGTRMKPLTETMPKPMVPILGKPKLQHTLDHLPAVITEVVMVINYLGRQIKDFFGGEYGGLPIKYIFQEELNGTGGALRACREVVQDKFLVMMGDDFYFPSDIEKMAREELAILASRVEQETVAAKIVVDENNQLVEIVEASDERNAEIDSNLINTGLYCLNKNYFNYDLVAISETEFGLPQTMVQMLKDHPIKIVEAEKWFPMSRAEDVQEAERVVENFFN